MKRSVHAGDDSVPQVPKQISGAIPPLFHVPSRCAAQISTGNLNGEDLIVFMLINKYWPSELHTDVYTHLALCFYGF